MSNMRYTSDHEWARLEDNNVVTVGITDFAQEQLGDIVYIEMPKVGDSFNAGDEIAIIESVKAAAELKTPVSGKIVEVNSELDGAPDTVNESPTDSGWFCRIEVDNTDEFNGLLSDDAYTNYLSELE